MHIIQLNGMNSVGLRELDGNLTQKQMRNEESSFLEASMIGLNNIMRTVDVYMKGED
jgi:hypothetical protein